MMDALPPVLMLHGWGGTYASTWQAAGWEQRLHGSGRAVIGINLPGHGTASASIDPTDYADLAGQVLRGLRYSQVDVIAYSLGAKVALAMAARVPGLVRRAVLCGLGGNVFAPEQHGDALAALLEQGADAWAAAPPSLAALARYGVGNGNDAARLAAVLRRPANPVLAPPALQALDFPVLVACGSADAVAQPVAPLLAALPYAQQLELAGVDHLGLTNQPALIDAATTFINRRQE